MNKLHYSHGTESGVLFHLIGALSEFGKLGMTAIANSREEVDELYRRTLAVLDRESALGRGGRRIERPVATTEPGVWFATGWHRFMYLPWLFNKAIVPTGAGKNSPASEGPRESANGIKRGMRTPALWVPQRVDHAGCAS